MTRALVVLALAACGHHEPQATAPPIPNTIPAEPADATVDADESDSCRAFFATLARARQCGGINTRTLQHFEQINADLTASYGKHEPSVLQQCADETTKLLAAVKVPCGW